ncbi:MAG: hypothetical protein KI793_16190 [Rivularia sp. (in: Bacteria)]|nr:hypothetical protein [Rivularia sp. MS3]
MSASINVKKTNRFIDPALYVAFGATGFVFLALIASAFFGKVLFSKTVRVAQEEVVKIEALKLEPQLVGALRIDAKASIPNNHAVVYEIQLLDKQGKLIASATKDAWRESGVWYEDGESGTWNEDDLNAGLDVRAKKNEEVTVAISVLEYENLSGGKARSLTTFSVDDVIGNQANKPKSTNPAINFDVKITNGVVDSRHLWPGLFGTLALAVMTYIAAPRSGKKVISEAINDSDPSDRATVGGADKLVRVKINVTSDETSPRSMAAKLVINDSYGEQLYSEHIPLKLTFHREDGKLEKVTGFAQKFFVLETQDSYGFRVEVIPDAPVDRTVLTVIDGNRTRRAVEAVHIS